MLVEPLDDIDGQHPWQAAVIWLTAIAALFPSRTRGAGILALATLLSRAHAASRYRLEATLLGLFDERNSVAAKLDAGEQTLAGHHKRIRALEMFITDAGIVADPPPFVPTPDPDNDSGASG